MDYRDFVRYTVLAACFALQRPDMKKKVLNAPEILEVIHEIPHLEDYMTALYNGEYAKFFTALGRYFRDLFLVFLKAHIRATSQFAAAIEQSLKLDRFLAAHYRFYVREMRIIAYAQLLESYRSLTIESMAHSFGVTEEFIDKLVSRPRPGSSKIFLLTRLSVPFQRSLPVHCNATSQRRHRQSRRNRRDQPARCQERAVPNRHQAR